MSNRTGPPTSTGLHPEDVLLNPMRLAVFSTVVERQSFSRAAEELLMSRPAVSLQVRALEAALGMRLFDQRRGARLTEAGRLVYDFAVRIHREVVSVRAELHDLAGGLAGAVTLGATQTPGSYILPGLLARFQRLHPAAQIRLHIHTSAIVSDEVQRGRWDFGVVSERTPILTGIQAEPVWTETNVVIAPPDHPLAGLPSVPLAALAGVTFVTGPPPPAGEPDLDTALKRAGYAPRRVVMEVGTPEAGKQAVLQGAGLAEVCQRAVESELASGHLVALPLEGVALTEQFYIIFRRGHRFSPLAQNLLAFLRADARGPAAGEHLRTAQGE